MIRLLSLALALFSVTVVAATVNTRVVNVADHSIHVVEWAPASEKADRTFILLSGPIDTWHSDTAWWAGFGHRLGKTWKGICP